jgi:hypothetical protein
MFVFGFFIGQSDANTYTHNKCVVKYSDMPYNKVEEHCKTILKFEKDAK